MKLVSFSIKKFRSITRAHKLALSNSTIFIGKNNEGKSNILNALAIAMELIRLHGSRRPHPRGPSAAAAIYYIRGFK